MHGGGSRRNGGRGRLLSVPEVVLESEEKE